MSISPEQAATALRDVERARSRSVELNAYRLSSPQLVLWGIFWIVGYGGTDLAPRFAGFIWAAIGVLWAIVSFLHSRRTGPKANAARRAAGWRFVAIFATLYIFIFCTVAVMHPRGMAMGAFIPLLVAAFYTIMGLWIGWRYSAIGIGLAVLTMVGYFLLHTHFLLWMAFVGGGALILTGLWLRRA